MIRCDIAVEFVRFSPCTVSQLDKLMKNWSIPENLIGKKFLSPKELKDILGISLPTVYRLIDSRKLPVFKVGNSLRFLKEDVLTYLETNRIDRIV
jgi:excisionase family DNA binding protein